MQFSQLSFKVAQVIIISNFLRSNPPTIDKFLLYKHNGQLVHPEIIKGKVALCAKLAEDMAFQFSNLLKEDVTSCQLN